MMSTAEELARVFAFVLAVCLVLLSNRDRAQARQP
jgi:hypothetical protein